MKAIKANEIRIGNLMQDQQGNILKVIGIVEGSISYHVVDRSKFPLENGWSAFPIPLTEEILLKARFEKDIESLFYRNNFIIAKTKTRWAFYHNGLTGGELVRIDYLHELQNLIFALMGEEIKIPC